MNAALSVYHGRFGRATLYAFDRPTIKHVHREGHLIFWLRGGQSAIASKNATCELSPEKGAAINSWEPHSYEPQDGAGDQYCLVLYVKPEWFTNFGRWTTAETLNFGRPEIEITPEVARLVTGVVEILSANGTTGLLDGRLFELTSACHEQSHRFVPGAQVATTERRINDFRVRRAIGLMNENVDQSIDLGEVAMESGLSRPHFFKLFQEQTGVTPKMFWNTIRMEHALTELAETPKSITEVGLDLGFSSQPSFSRFFALNTGTAPIDYRKAAQMHRP